MQYVLSCRLVVLSPTKRRIRINQTEVADINQWSLSKTRSEHFSSETAKLLEFNPSVTKGGKKIQDMQSLVSREK